MSDPTSTPPPEDPTPTAQQPGTPPPPASEPPPSAPPSAPPNAGYQQPGQQPGYGSAPGYDQPHSGVGAPADLLMRFLARLIDFILVGIVAAIIAVIIAAITGLSVSGFGYSMGAGFAASAISAVINAVLYLGYFTVMESRNGQTIGKLALKLQTQGPDGNPPTQEQAFKRNIWTGLSILGIVPIVGGLIGALISLVAEIMIAVTISNSPTKQGWHDNYAGGTKVIKIG